MPLYEYRCRECDHQFEIQQSISDEALTTCPACKGTLRKVFQPVGIAFKGSGFYKTDSRGSKSASTGSSGSTAGSSGSSSNGSSSDSSGSTSTGSGSSSSGSNGSGSNGSGTSSPAPAATSD